MLRIFIAAAFFFISSVSIAGAQGRIELLGPYAFETPPGATTGAVYLTISNVGSGEDSLTGISTSAAEKAEAHVTINDNGIMRMSSLASPTIKPNESLIFAPGGRHVMLIGLKQQLKGGTTFPITLTFAKAGAIEATVTVKSRHIGPKS